MLQTFSRKIDNSFTCNWGKLQLLTELFLNSSFPEDTKVNEAPLLHFRHITCSVFQLFSKPYSFSFPGHLGPSPSSSVSLPTPSPTSPLHHGHHQTTGIQHSCTRHRGFNVKKGDASLVVTRGEAEGRGHVRRGQRGSNVW